MAKAKAQEKTESCTGATENTEGAAVMMASEQEPTDTEPTEPEPSEPEPSEQEPTDTEPTDTEPTEPEEEKSLIAVYPILFESHQYKPGEELPTHNLEMLDLWIENGVAKWMSTEKVEAMWARPASASAGLPGRAVPSSQEDLVGKIPNTGIRGRK